MAEHQVKAPSGLGPRGRGLWRKVTKTWALDVDDHEILHEACSLLDEMDLMKAAVAQDGPTTKGSAGQLVEHPSLVGLRTHRRVLAELLTRLGLPSEEAESPSTPATSKAQKAARSRWQTWGTA